MIAKRQGLMPRQVPKVKHYFAAGWTVKRIANHFGVEESALEQYAPPAPAEEKPKKKPMSKTSGKGPTARKKSKRARTPDGKSN